MKPNSGTGRRVAIAAALPAALGLAGAAPSQAQTAVVTPPPQNVVTLAASASSEVANDWLTIVLSTAREGADAATVQSQLQGALDAALAEARAQAQPGRVEVRTGNFSLYPRNLPKGGIGGWQGSAELMLQGRDTAAIARLATRISTLTVARVGFSLSRSAREQAEGELTAQAIDRFRAKAEAISRQFGFGAYAIREVTVGFDEPPIAVPKYRVQAARAGGAADEALPVEAGKSEVTVSVSGSVQMSGK